LVSIMLPKEKTALPLEICWPARRLLRQW
jgi:hypothetical protein